MEAIQFRLSEESEFEKGFKEFIDLIDPLIPKNAKDFKELYHGEGAYSFLPDWGETVNNYFDNVKEHAVDWWNNFEISDYVDDDSLFFTVLSSVTTSSLELAALYLVARYIIIPVGKELISYCINNVDFDSILNNIQKGIKNTKEILISAKIKVVAIKDKIVDALCKTTEKVKTFFVKTKDVVKSVCFKAKEYIQEKIEKAKSFVHEKYEKAKDYVHKKIDSTKEYIKDKYKNAKEIVKEKYEQAKDFVKDKVDKAKNWLKRLF